MPIDASRYRLCLVTDRDLGHGRPLIEVVMRAVAGGVTMVQLREKTATTRAFLDEARALRAEQSAQAVGLVEGSRSGVCRRSHRVVG